MKIIKTDFKDLFLFEPVVNTDNRGEFIEIFRKNILNELISYNIDFCQYNRVKSVKKTLRGLHYQVHPFSQSKLISVSHGKILDVVVDLRKTSKSYGKYFSVELSSQKNNILFIPKGFAHGYITLSEIAIVDYKVDNYYYKDSERGIAFNDPYLNIDWQIENEDFIISKKDKFFKNYNW